MMTSGQSLRICYGYHGDSPDEIITESPGLVVMRRPLSNGENVPSPFPKSYVVSHDRDRFHLGSLPDPLPTVRANCRRCACGPHLPATSQSSPLAELCSRN